MFKKAHDTLHFGSFNKDEQLHGRGIITQNILKDGIFEDGRLVFGICFNPDEKLYYSGCFDKDEKLHGNGQISLDSQCTHLIKEGIFEHGRLISGMSLLCNTKYNFGNFDENERFDGYGETYEDKDKTRLICKGMFRDGKLLHGEYHFFGRVYVGNFNGCKLFGEGVVYNDVQKQEIAHIGWYERDMLIFGLEQIQTFGHKSSYHYRKFLNNSKRNQKQILESFSLEILKKFQDIHEEYITLSDSEVVDLRLVDLLITKLGCNFLAGHHFKLRLLKYFKYIQKIYNILDNLTCTVYRYDCNVNTIICSYFHPDFKPQKVVHQHLSTKTKKRKLQQKYLLQKHPLQKTWIPKQGVTSENKKQ